MIPNNDLSFQIFSSRDAATLDEQLKLLAGLGHTDVQPFFFGPPDYLALLKAQDLTPKSGHFTLDLFTDMPDLVEMILLPDGSHPIDHILGDTVPFEPDLVWMGVGGVDPMAFLKKYAGRIPAVQVKDVAELGTCLDEKGFADLGYGVMDWQRLLDASVVAGAQLMVVEHDLPRRLDPLCKAVDCDNATDRGRES